MFIFQLALFIILAVNAYCGKRNNIKPTNIPAPVDFKYLDNDVLSINVRFINLPRDITEFLLHVQTDRHPPKTTRPKIHDDDKIFQVRTPLNVKNVVADIEIRNNMQQFCAVRNILNGSASTGADGRSQFRENCLTFKDYHCTIVVDFKKKCDSPDLKCYIEDRTLNCDSDGLSNVTWSQQHLDTSDSNDRQEIFLHAGAKTRSRLKMKIYKFDINTQILVESIYYKKSYKLTTFAEVEDYEVTEKLFFNETQQSISFTCKDANSYIGLIYDNNSKIRIYKRNQIEWPCPKNLLYRLFCCIQTNIYNNDDVMVIERIVNQFTEPLLAPTSGPAQWTTDRPKPMCTLQTDYTLHCECGAAQSNFLHQYKWSQVTITDDKEQELWSYETKSEVLTMPIYKFDNNSIITCEEITQDRNNHDRPIRISFKINIPDDVNGIPHFNTFKNMNQTIPFTYSAKVNLNCSKNAYISLIYRKDELIERQHLNDVFIKNKMTYPRACCIYFEDLRGSLLREIKNVTLLIPVQNEITTQDTVEGNLKPMTRPLEHYDQTITDTTISNSSYLWLYIAIPIVFIVIVVVSIISFCCLKKRRNTPECEQMLQMETYSTTEKVLYAKLDLKPQNDAPVPKINESPYAEIIGVLHKHR